MTQQDNLCWKINWYRQSELEGALLLGRMVRSVADADLVTLLTRHCVEEANHSQLWIKTLTALRLPVIRIFRSYQSFYVDPVVNGQGGGMPANLAEVLAFTHIFEHRVDQQFRTELDDPRTPAPMRETLATMIRDEQRHLDWVARWLHTQPDSELLLARYRRIDNQVYQQLSPYLEHIYDIPGLGEPGPKFSNA